MRRFRGAQLFLCAMAVGIACTADRVLSPHVPADDASRVVIVPGSCAFKPWGWTRGYFSHSPTDTITICGAKFTLTSAPRTAADAGPEAIWYYGSWGGASGPESTYIASGTYQPGDRNRIITIQTDSPIEDVQMVWQFSPAPGGKATLYDATGTPLDSFTVPVAQEASPYEVVSGIAHTQASYTSGAKGVRRIRLESPGHGGAASQLMVQLFFRPDTTCPPTGVPELDDSATRRFLVDEYDRGMIEGLERPGWVVYDSTSGAYQHLPDPAAPRSACRATVRWDPQLIQGGLRPLFYYHTHVRIAGAYMNCATSHPEARALRGPSPDDIMGAMNNAAPNGVKYDSVVIDALFVYHVKGGTGQVREWPWHSANHCR